MEKFIVANGIASRYMDSGTDKPAIVLLHGYLESIDIWENLGKKLAPYFRVLAIDIPGHGVSEIISETHSMELLADFIESWLKKIGISRCVIAGHSMGGYVALAFAKKYPDYVAGIVLIHASPDPDTPERKENRIREIEVIKAGRKEMLSRLNPGKSFAEDNKKRFAGVIAEMSEQIMLTEDEGIIALLNGIMEREDMNPVLQKLNAPELFIFGKKDNFIPVKVAESIIGKNPQAEVAWLENAGHMGFIEEEEQCITILRSFTIKAFHKEITE
ncbi:MAG TPA: alpha/beta hydrolase [Candidatus Avirikenella pullistercoris]|nr:alpha/beta hydrolase [Candidatus Avirikenella pullistercoris]